MLAQDYRVGETLLAVLTEIYLEVARTLFCTCVDLRFLYGFERQ